MSEQQQAEEQTPATSINNNNHHDDNHSPQPRPRDPLLQALLPDAKHARVSRWRSEVDPADVVCACSERLELHRTSRSAAAACSRCSRPGETLEQSRSRGGSGASSASGAGGRQQQQQQQKKSNSVFRRFFIRRSAAKGAVSDSLTDSAAGSRESFRPLRVAEDGGTQMYRQDEADDEASGSSMGELSDSARGKGRLKLRVDDTAARLRRAQKLMNAQALRK
ncbi:hypothetical protein TruAng_004280 [Truncatella angustata]|nr:hypothetical protein TruAng_004280 [Truncatella angustata]